MSKFSIIFTILIIFITGWFLWERFGTGIVDLRLPSISHTPVSGASVPSDINIDVIDPPSIIPSKPASEINIPDKKSQMTVAYVYFLSLDKNNNTVYKRVEKTVSMADDKLSVAINILVKGPDFLEKSLGTYSEIPSGVKLNGIKYTKDKVIIDLSSDFQYGGGTDSIYSRMMQLIKTAIANTDYKKIYLYLDGKQVNTIGGEGIMITQPLSEKSLDL